MYFKLFNEGWLFYLAFVYRLAQARKSFGLAKLGGNRLEDFGFVSKSGDMQERGSKERFGWVYSLTFAPVLLVPGKPVFRPSRVMGFVMYRRCCCMDCCTAFFTAMFDGLREGMAMLELPEAERRFLDCSPMFAVVRVMLAERLEHSSAFARGCCKSSALLSTMKTVIRK